MGVGDQKTLVFGDVDIVVARFVGDEETVWVTFLGQDSSADESVFAVTFDVFLNCDDVVAQLLEGEVMKVPGVDYSHVVAVVVGLVLVDQSLQCGY